MALRNSKYYTYGATALTLDDLTALQQAATAQNQPDVAQVYAEQIQRQLADDTPSTEIGFYTTAQNLKAKYERRWEIFRSLFIDYLVLSTTTDLSDLKEAYSDLLKHFTDLETTGIDFATYAADPKSRQILYINDQGYQDFVYYAQMYRTSPPNFDEIQAKINAEFKDTLAAYNEKREQVMQVGASCLAQTKRAQCIVIAPTSPNGVYTYTEFKEEGL